MDKRRNRDQIQNALNTTLSGLKDDPWLAQCVIAEAKGEVKVKKKISVGLVLALILALITVTALAMGALSGLLRFTKSDLGAMRSCVSSGDALYFMSSSGLHKWAPGNEKPEMLISTDALSEQGFSFESLLFFDQDALGLMDAKNKKIGYYRNSEIELCLDDLDSTVDLPPFTWKSIICQDKSLFLLAQAPDDSTSNPPLYRIDLTTWETTQFTVKEGFVEELCSYEPGKLLLLVSHADQKSESVLVLDAVSLTTSEILYTSPIQQVHGMAYSKEHGGLYAIVSGVLSRWNGTAWVSLNAAAHSFLSHSFAIVDGGYVSISFDELQYLPFTSEDATPPLTIRGMMCIDNADADFQNANGIAVIRHLDPVLTAQDVKDAVETGDTTDLFLLNIDADVLALIDGGLVAPLSASTILTEDAHAMLRVMQDALFVHDTLYAMAYLATPLIWQGDKPLPETYTELLTEASAGRFVIAYDRGKPFTKVEYANALLEAFIAESTFNSEAIDFHSEAFASALLTLKNMTLPSASYSTVQTSVNPAKVLSLGGDFPEHLPQSGQRYYDMENKYPDEPHWLLPPTVTVDSKPSIPVKLSVYLLNPHAQNPEAAIAYLEYVAAHRDPGDEGLMKPNIAKPVLHPAVQEELDWGWETASSAHQDELRAYEAAVRAAPDSWAITEYRLNVYQQMIAPYLDLRLHPLLSASAKQEGGTYKLLLEILLDYVEGNKTLDECLNALQKAAANDLSYHEDS